MLNFLQQKALQVIIDNMINLELLFVYADLTGNDTFRQMAITHADQTLLWHIRPDGKPGPPSVRHNLTIHSRRWNVPRRGIQLDNRCSDQAQDAARIRG